MTLRQRAIAPTAKQERRDAILDAAARLLARRPDSFPSVADVAGEAGLAKGTVYLYFAGKEELLLAVHERNVAAFFAALLARLERPEPAGIDDLLALTRRHVVEPPLVLPLAARCFALMGQAVPVEAAAAFHARMGARLAAAGAALERHFPRLAPGQGAAKLRHSFALVVGLWEMSTASACAAPPREARPRPAGGGAPPPAARVDYADDLACALPALWADAAGA